MGLMEWLGIVITYIAWRRGQKAQNFDRASLPFRSYTALFGAWFSVIGIISMRFPLHVRCRY